MIHAHQSAPKGAEAKTPITAHKSLAPAQPTLAPAWERALTTTPLLDLQLPIQTKLTVNQPGDEFEQQADRVADQVLAAPMHSKISGAPPRIQPLSAPALGEVDTASTSVDRVLASSGRTLEPALRQDMGQRFDHDFSKVRVLSGEPNQPVLGHTPSLPVERLLGSPGQPLGIGEVRIHTDSAATESAQSMRARAYTYGQHIVFDRGEFNPSSPGGRTLLNHELAHTTRQSLPARYRLAFQKQSAAPAKFFTEVEDAVIALQSRVGTVDDLSYLRDLLALSEEVEAQNKTEAKQLTLKVVGASPSSAEPVARSEEFVNELVTRTFLMGLDSEANSLRTFFRALATVPSRREPTDTQYGADKNLWQKLATRTVEQAKFGNATEAATSIDSLLNTFRIICVEAKRINFNEVVKDRKLNYSAGATYNSDTLDSYFSTLIGQLRNLTVPIFHGVEIMMRAAIADLEADKGATSLSAAKAVINTKIFPAYNLTIGDENLLSITVDATRSNFGAQEGKHLDYFDTTKAAEKRSVTINYFDKNQTGDVLYDKSNPVGYIILARQGQVAFLQKLYDSSNRAAMGATPLKIESVDDWRNFLYAKVLELRTAGKSNGEILTTIIDFLSSYLETFTTSTPFNIEDVIKQDSENYNKRQLPHTITGQLIEDCGVYALRTVYMLSLVKVDLNLRIRFIYLPVHVGLIITGDGMPTLIAHNNKIYPIDTTALAEERKRWEAKDPTKPITDEQFIGEVAGSYFTPGVDLPFRLEDAPTIAKDDPQEKEKLQKYYEGTLKKDVLADAPKAGITQFHLEYLRLNDEAKQLHNSVVVPTWNNGARKAWEQHKDKLFAELAKARKGKPNDYDAESKAYLADLDAVFKPVEAAATAADPSRKAVSTTLGAHPELTGKTATRGYGSRVSFVFNWQLPTHRAAVADQTNLNDPTKPDAITPPFGDPKHRDFVLYPMF